MAQETRSLLGNRLTLIGAIWYLLEWVAIIAFARVAPPAPGRAAEVAAYYSAQATNLMIAAGLFGLLEIGRIAYIAGLRGSLRQTAHIRGLLDLALGAMVLSVGFEVAEYSVAAAAGQMAAAGGDRAGVVSLAYASASIGLMVPTAIAVSVEAASLAQLLSRQFPWWLTILGLVAGAFGIVSSTYSAATGTIGGGRGLWVPAMWIWMIATGVILFRRVGRSPESLAAVNTGSVG